MTDILLLSPDAIQSLRDRIGVDFYNDRKELESYSISLDKDASSKSPAVLYQKLFQAREYTNRSGVIYSKYLKVSVLTKKLLLQRTEERRVAISHIFQENIDILSRLRSSDEKNKYCESLLDASTENAFIQAKLFQEEANGYAQYFKMQFDFYKDIKQDILTQLGIIRSMLMLGELPLINDLKTPAQDVDITTIKPDAILGEGVVSV